MLAPFWTLLDKSSFSGFLSLVEHRLGIGYLWHAEDAWAPNVHDVDPLSFACKKEMVGICYTLPFLLIFHNCSFMERTYFQQVFTCHGIYLECILAVFSQVRTSSIKRLQSESDIKVTDTAQLIHCDSLDWTGGVTQIRWLHGKPSFGLGKHHLSSSPSLASLTHS